MRWNATVYNSLGLVRDNRVIDPSVKSVDGYLDLPTIFISGSSLNVLNLDVTAPTIPTNLRSTISTNSTISLSWDSAIDPAGGPGENVTGVVSHSLYRNGQFRVTIPIPATSFIDTGLTSETVYSYQILATDGAGNSSPLSSPVVVLTTAFPYPTADELWADAPPFPTVAQVESASEWEMNSWDGTMQGLVVDIYPRDEGHPQSMSVGDALLLIKNSAAKGGMLRVHYGTSGVHKVYSSGHPDVIAELVTSDQHSWLNYGGHLYVIGIPDANGNRPSIEGQLGQYTATGVPVFPALFSRSHLKGGDTFFKDINLKSIKSGDAVVATGGRCTTSEGYPHDQPYLYLPPKKLVMENVTIDCHGAPRAVIFGPEWDSKMTDVNARRLGIADIDNECWFRNVDFGYSASSHLIYIDRIKKCVIVDSKFHDPSPSGNSHVFKVDAQEIFVVGNEISNCALDGTVTSCAPNLGLDGRQHLGAVPCSLVAGQRGYFCNNKVTHYRRASFYSTGAYSVHQQIRTACHALEDPLPLDGPFGPRYAASDYYDPNWWTNNATQWILYCYENHFVKAGPDDRNNPGALRIYKNSGTWPVWYSAQPLNQLDNQILAAKNGVPSLATNLPKVPAEWWERSQVITGGDTVEGFGDAVWDAYNAGDKTIFYQSQTDIIGNDETINPTDDFNTINGTGVGRYIIESDPTRLD